jgi:hypothetical protein
MRSRAALVVVAVTIVVGVPLLLILLTSRSAPFDAELVRLLNAGSTEQRKQAAWRVAEERAGVEASLAIRPRLETGEEPDPDVREAYVYVLGRVGAAGFTDTVETVARTDESGYVRAAAWLALARLDADCFRQLVALQAAPEDPWDQIGVAQGWAEHGDYRGLSELLHWAGQGDHSQRVVAGRALLNSVAPLLEAVGRWPLDAEVQPGEPWSPELISEVARRIQGLELESLAREVWKRFEATRHVRRNVARLTGARERLARLLFSR